MPFLRLFLGLIFPSFMIRDSSDGESPGSVEPSIPFYLIPLHLHYDVFHRLETKAVFILYVYTRLPIW